MTQPAPSVRAPTTQDAIGECTAWAWTMERYVASSEAEAKHYEAAGNITAAVAAYQGRDDWQFRVNSLLRAVEVLNLIVECEDEVRSVVRRHLERKRKAADAKAARGGAR